MAHEENGATRKRERSTRYPGRPLGESLDLAGFIADKGLDGLPATEIAGALGYSNVKTNTFSARLSAARQFGLLTITGDGYCLTPMARSILHPVDPSELPSLRRQALLCPPLYAELAAKLSDKKVPEASILANVLYHQHQIIASAKDSAAETFLESARFAGALGDDGIFRPNGVAAADPSPMPSAPPRAERVPKGSRGVAVDLRLWGPDQGKSIRLRAPESISKESYDRFLQTFLLLVRIDEKT